MVKPRFLSHMPFGSFKGFGYLLWVYHPACGFDPLHQPEVDGLKSNAAGCLKGTATGTCGRRRKGIASGTWHVMLGMGQN